MSTATASSRPPFRAEHLGSLLRPNGLLEKRAAVDDGSASEAELQKAEDAAIMNIVGIQQELGFRALSDGEYRRHMFWGSFFDGLNGFKGIKNPPIDMFRTYMPDIAAFQATEHKQPGDSVICDGKISHTGQSTYIGQVEYLQGLVPKSQWHELKLTLPAPEWYHMRYKEGKAYPKDVYSNDAEYFGDIAKAYQTELDILYKHGVRNIQMDDPNFAYFCSETMLAGWKEDKENKYSTDELLEGYIKLYNECISKAPADMHIGLHICRGNYVGSRHFSEGGYDRIAVKLFQELNVNTYYLEYDTPRAGGFEPLKHLPKNKNVILGVVTSKFPELENKEAMKERIYAAADIIAQGCGQTRQEALKRVGVSPQCGFASHSHGNAVSHGDMINKLALVRNIANEVWNGEP